MPYPLPLTRTEAYLAYKAGVIQQSDLKPSLAVPRNGIDAWLAYWTGIAEDYPKREDGTPHILQEEEAYIAYLSGVINEYPEKCLRRVGAYLRYLISARWGRPDHPLNREELYLSLIKTQFIPSGDPSSDIVIDGTAKAPFVDVKMYGDTFQQNYDGKNLWGGFASDFSKTSSGVTFVNKADGTITANGTATGTALSLFSTEAISQNRLITLSAGDYIISGATDVVRLEVINTSGGVVADTSGSISGVRAFSISEQTRVAVRAKMANTYVADNVIVKPMLEAGSTASDYEPFVGGQPSPNSEYPQPIQTVTGLQTVEIVGKNKYPFNDTVWSSSQTASQWSFQNGSTNAYGANITDKTAYKFTLPAGTYTMTAFDITSNIINIQACTNGESSETIVTSPSNINSENLSSTITLTETTTLCVRYRTTNPSLGIGNTKIQIEQAESASSFAPYSKQTLSLDLGTIELCEFRNSNDRIWKDGEDWKIHKVGTKVTYDGSEDWNISNSGTTNYYYRIPSGIVTSGDTTDCLSNYETAHQVTNSNTVNGIWKLAGGQIRIRSGQEMSLADWKAKLASKPLDFYVALSTATDTIITDTNLIAQLEALVNGGSEEGTTYIRVSATDPNLPALLYVEAPKYD